MRLFLDECLSPRVANELMAEEDYYVVHPRNQGGLGEADHTVLARCIEPLFSSSCSRDGTATRLPSPLPQHP
jgi:hypothetical protein